MPLFIVALWTCGSGLNLCNALWVEPKLRASPLGWHVDCMTERVCDCCEVILSCAPIQLCPSLASAAAKNNDSWVFFVSAETGTYLDEFSFFFEYFSFSFQLLWICCQNLVSLIFHALSPQEHLSNSLLKFILMLNLHPFHVTVEQEAWWPYCSTEKGSQLILSSLFKIMPKKK